MSLEDEYKLYTEAYFGILEVDEYTLNIYEAKKIEKIMNDFKGEYKIENSEEIIRHVKEEVSLKTKLQSALIVLNQIKGPMELILIIKNKLKELMEEV